MQDLSIYSRVQSSASVARTPDTEPWFGFGRALPSAVRAEVGAFKTVLNIRIVPDSPGQQPKKVADDSQNVWHRLPAKPEPLCLPCDRSQDDVEGTRPLRCPPSYRSFPCVTSYRSRLAGRAATATRPAAFLGGGILLALLLPLLLAGCRAALNHRT